MTLAQLRNGRFVFRPRGDEPVPVIMSAHPYGKDAVPGRSRSGRALNPQYRIMPQPDRVGISAWTGWEAPDPAFWVPRGYAVVNADARGGGTSEGQAHLFEAQEADDYEDLIAWAGTQPWSTGKVGLDGVSYLALSQYAVAARAPEQLAAICPWEGFSDLYRDFAWPGGIRENGFAVLWSTLTARAARVAPPPLRRELARHTTRDQWYRDRTPDIDRIGVPVLVCGSFSDHNLHTRGSFEVFRRAGQARPERPRRWLYTHRGGKWATYYSTDAASIRARFFDHTLRDLDNGWDALPPVRLAVYESGPTPVAVTAESEWPPADLRMRRLFLDGGGNARRDLVHPIDDTGDGFDRADGVGRRGLNLRDLRGDFVGRLCRLGRQFLDLTGDDGKPLAGVTRPRGLDGGIQRQHVGLLRNVGDQFHHLAHPLGRLRQAADLFVGETHVDLGFVRDPGGLRHLARDLLDRIGQLLGGR